MSQTRSDNRAEKHGKPVQDGERKLVNGVFVDYDDLNEVFTLNPTVTWRANKYYWVAGTKIHLDSDGVTPRQVSVSNAVNGAINALLIVIGTGTATADFDRYAAAGSQLQANELYGKRVIQVVLDNTVFDTFNPTAGRIRINKTDQAPNLSFLDFSQVGGLYDGQSVIILYQ